jgi:predicted lipoprotein with Yx(FWY)xxD motif
MFKSLPTMVWVIGATVAVAALSPAVGNIATTAPAVAPPAAKPQPPAAAPSKAPPSKAKPATPVEEPVVIKAGTTKLGQVAVDAAGFTLYMSVLDSRNPSKSVCKSKACLTAWKPVYVKKAGIVAGAGVSQARIGKLIRPDKDIQATLNGWPLYRFAKDQKPGDVLGEGLKGTWHVLSPAGTRLNARR